LRAGAAATQRDAPVPQAVPDETRLYADVAGGAPIPPGGGCGQAVRLRGAHNVGVHRTEDPAHAALEVGAAQRCLQHRGNGLLRSLLRSRQCRLPRARESTRSIPSAVGEAARH